MHSIVNVASLSLPLAIPHPLSTVNNVRCICRPFRHRSITLQLREAKLNFLSSPATIANPLVLQTIAQTTSRHHISIIDQFEAQSKVADPPHSFGVVVGSLARTVLRPTRSPPSRRLPCPTPSHRALQFTPAVHWIIFQRFSVLRKGIFDSEQMSSQRRSQPSWQA